MNRIWNREPALWLGLVAIIVKLLAAFGMDVSADQQAVINAVAAALVGLVLAVVAHDAIGAAVLGFAQAVLALAIGFGLDWSAEQQAVVLAAAAAIVAMWDRTQITAPVPAVAVAPVRSV
jgi:prepilin signal peptidase PulO-like enzyme (type II secretory pathway)